MIDWLANSINFSEALGSFAANMIQWLIIGLLLFYARIQGKRIDHLKDSNRGLEGALYALFGEVVQLPEQARIECKSLLRDVANEINRHGISNFDEAAAKTSKEAVDAYWSSYGDKFKKLPQAESKFDQFFRAMNIFLDNVSNPSAKNASPILKREFQNVKQSWSNFFDIAFASMPLDEDEIKKKGHA